MDAGRGTALFLGTRCQKKKRPVSGGVLSSVTMETASSYLFLLLLSAARCFVDKLKSRLCQYNSLTRLDSAV